MDTVLELAFEGLRLFVRLLAAALQLLFEGLRSIAGPIIQILLEIIIEPIAQSCARSWRRIHGWVGHVTGLPRLAIPISILVVMALVAGGFVAFVQLGQAIF
jgi:hypothetical protein